MVEAVNYHFSDCFYYDLWLTHSTGVRGTFKIYVRYKPPFGSQIDPTCLRKI